MTSSELARVPVPAVPGRRRDLAPWLLIALLGVLVAIPVIAALVSAASAPGLPKGDFALIEMRSLDVPGNLPLTGVYSRYGWDHPGPLLFYLAALPLRLFGPVGLQVTAALINLASAVGLVVVMFRRGGQVLAVLGAIFALLVIRSLQIEVVSIWNPWVPILPLALAVALAWSVWCRDWWMLPWLAVVVTFIAQSHVQFVLAGTFLLGTSSVWALAVLLRERRSPSAYAEAAPPVRWPLLGTTSVGRSLVVSIGLLGLLWLPPLVDQLTRQPGNLSSLLDFARSTPAGDTVVGPGAALRLLSGVVGIDGTLADGITRTVLFIPDGTAVWHLAVVLVPFLLAASFALWRGARDAVRLAVIVGALVVVGWASLARMVGLAYPYLTEWLLVVGGYLWLSAIWCVISAMWPSVVDLSLVPHRSQDVRSQRVAAVAAVCLLVVVAVTVPATATSPGDGYAGVRVVERFADPATGAIGDANRVLVTAGPTDETNAAWWLETTAIVAGLQAELQRRGLDVVAVDSQEFAVGPEHVVGDRPVDLRLIVSADTSVAPSLGAGTVASYDYLDPTERRHYQDLDRKGGTLPPTPLEGADLEDWLDLRGRAVQYTLSVQDG